jgi:hypothetical protein
MSRSAHKPSVRIGRSRFFGGGYTYNTDTVQKLVLLKIVHGFALVEKTRVQDFCWPSECIEPLKGSSQVERTVFEIRTKSQNGDVLMLFRLTGP